MLMVVTGGCSSSRGQPQRCWRWPPDPARVDEVGCVSLRRGAAATFLWGQSVVRFGGYSWVPFGPLSASGSFPVDFTKSVFSFNKWFCLQLKSMSDLPLLPANNSNFLPSCIGN